MKEILENLALIDLTNFCRDNGIDCSDTHLTKNGRGFNYSLVQGIAGRALVTVSFSKNSVPSHYIHKTN